MDWKLLVLESVRGMRNLKPGGSRENREGNTLALRPNGTLTPQQSRELGT